MGALGGSGGGGGMGGMGGMPMMGGGDDKGTPSPVTKKPRKDPTMTPNSMLQGIMKMGDSMGGMKK